MHNIIQELMDQAIDNAIDNAADAIKSEFNDFIDEAEGAIELEVLKKIRMSRLKNFYLNNNIAFKNCMRSIEFARKIKEENLSASIIFSSMATESVIIQAIIKPLIYCSVTNDELSALIAGEFKKNMDINKAKKYINTLMIPIMGEEFSLSKKTIDRNGKNTKPNLWNSRVDMASLRNEIVHDAVSCESLEDAEFSIEIASEFIEMAVSILNSVDLHLDEKSLISGNQTSLFGNLESNENEYVTKASKNLIKNQQVTSADK